MIRKLYDVLFSAAIITTYEHNMLSHNTMRYTELDILFAHILYSAALQEQFIAQAPGA